MYIKFILCTRCCIGKESESSECKRFNEVDKKTPQYVYQISNATPLFASCNLNVLYCLSLLFCYFPNNFTPFPAIDYVSLFACVCVCVCSSFQSIDHRRPTNKKNLSNSTGSVPMAKLMLLATAQIHLNR